MKMHTQQEFEKHIEKSEYWADKNGYEQEAVRELIVIVKMLVDDLYKSGAFQDEER